MRHNEPQLIDVEIRCDCNNGEVVDDFPLRVNRAGEVQVIDCSKCNGSGFVMVERCEQCGKPETCPCYDSGGECTVGQLSSQKFIFSKDSFSKLGDGWPIWAKAI